MDYIKQNQEIILYYFTGTGNSLKIAKDIGLQMGEHTLISMTKVFKQEENIIIKGDIIGFVFPVYFARPPAFVQEFIAKSKFEGASYIFAVENGGGLFGKALKIFEKYINNKGKKLDAGFIINMPGNHPKIASMQKTQPEEHYIQEAHKVEEIAKCVKAKNQHRVETNFGLMGNVFSYLAFKKLYKQSQAKKLDEALWVNDNCINCGTCERICPTDNITGSKTKPQWNNKCINCLACYHHCKQKAIQMIGEENNMARYHHPEIKLEELFDE